MPIYGGGDVVNWAKSRRIVSRPACGNGKKVLAVATFVATFVPLAPVYAQVSVPRSQIADTSKSARRCDVLADCSGLSIDDIRALFTDDADADMAYFEIASRRFAAVNIRPGSQRERLAPSGTALKTLGPFGLADASLKLGSLTVNMDCDNPFPQSDPMASADLVISLHRRF